MTTNNLTDNSMCQMTFPFVIRINAGMDLMHGWQPLIRQVSRQIQVMNHPLCHFLWYCLHIRNIFTKFACGNFTPIIIRPRGERRLCMLVCHVGNRIQKPHTRVTTA